MASPEDTVPLFQIPDEELNRFITERPYFSYDELADRFRLDLNGRFLREPRHEHGWVDEGGVEERPPLSFEGHEVPVKDMLVVDPYVDADFDNYLLLNNHIQKLEGVLDEHGFDPYLHRQEPMEVNAYGHFTRAWLEDPAMLPMLFWRKNVPHSDALFYIHHPDRKRRLFTRADEMARITKEAAMYLRFADDAVAIRDRGVGMRHIAENHLLASPKDELRWLSLASGAGEPAMIAAQSAMDKSNKEVYLTLADLDPKAIEDVPKNARLHNFDPRYLEAVRASITRPRLDYHLAMRTGREDQLYDVVDIMGFFEYLKQPGDELPSSIDLKLPTASFFAHNAFKRVKPGGIMLASNMMIDRPQLKMLTGIVGWPYINIRSENSLLRVFYDAGILDDPSASVRLWRIINKQSGARIYDIVEVAKSELAQAA